MEFRKSKNVLENLKLEISSVDVAIAEIKNVMEALSTGDFSQRIKGDYGGDFLQIKDAVNDTAEKLSQYLENEVSKERELKEIAEEVSRAKSDFLARMSHEIRTPISSVMGISEMELKSSDLSPRIEKSFATIYNSSTKLLSIVNDILDISKIGAGKMELLIGEYEVASMIVDMSYIHQAMVESKDIIFNMDVDENLPTLLYGDALRIGQIVKNLLSNAFKYTESGTVNLTVQCERYVDASEEITLVITVSDTGYGMTGEQVEALGKEYTRHHERINRKISGTGLGVPIVFKLAKMMNATVDIDSEVDVGTTVTVRIPQRAAGNEVLGEELAESLRQFEEGTKLAARSVAFKTEPMPYGKVLVVDDVNANLYVAKGLLSFYDLNVETCLSGYETINLIKAENSYDVIFMDYTMPGMNGVETMIKLRDMGYDEPIVVLTANATAGQAEEFLKMGFDGFLSKPIQTKLLNIILVKYIKDKQPPEVIQAAKLFNINKKVPTGDINSYMSNPELLSKLRSDFSRSHKDTYEALVFSLETGDMETAHRLAHTIKGSAGLIGEKKLSTMALDLEQKVKNGVKLGKDSLAAFKEELKSVISNIDMPDNHKHSGDEMLSAEESLPLLEKIEPLIAEQNIDCIDMLDEISKIPGSQELHRKLEDYDFDTAIETLAELKESLIEK